MQLGDYGKYNVGGFLGVAAFGFPVGSPPDGNELVKHVPAVRIGNEFVKYVPAVRVGMNL